MSTWFNLIYLVIWMGNDYKSVPLGKSVSSDSSHSSLANNVLKNCMIFMENKEWTLDEFNQMAYAVLPFSCSIISQWKRMLTGFKEIYNTHIWLEPKGYF